MAVRLPEGTPQGDTSKDGAPAPDPSLAHFAPACEGHAVKRSADAWEPMAMIERSAVFKLPNPLEHFAVDFANHLAPVAVPAGVGDVDYERLGQIGCGAKKDMPSPPATEDFLYDSIVLARQLIDNRVVHSPRQRLAILFIFGHGSWDLMLCH